VRMNPLKNFSSGCKFFKKRYNSTNKEKESGGSKMLNLNKQLRFSEYEGIYEVVVSKEHFLRKIMEKVDFSFVNRLMAKCYSDIVQ